MILTLTHMSHDVTIQKATEIGAQSPFTGHTAVVRGVYSLLFRWDNLREEQR